MESCTLFCVLVMFIMSVKCGGSSGCKTYERNALIKFNQSLNYNLLSPSWDEEERDCCKWARVTCDNYTGHVVQLHLRGENTYASLLNFNNSEYSLQYLVELKHLEHLDFSSNVFNFNPIPRVIGSMKQLRYLNLSNNAFAGLVPYELGNLTNLQVLDMNTFFVGIVSDSLNWVTSLRKLEYLGMSGVNLSKAHDWVDSLIGPLPSLRVLMLSSCQLSTSITHDKAPLKNSSLGASLIHHLDLGWNSLNGTFPAFIQNLTFLDYLNLSGNKFRANIPYWLGRLHRLEFLHLGNNKFTDIEGGLWNILGNLCRLRTLDIKRNLLKGNLFQPRENMSRCHHHDLNKLFLFKNKISGSIPAWLGETFKSLNELDLSNNNLSGHVPKSLGMLSSMTHLDISFNQFRGTILSQAHFANLKSLTYLNMKNTFIELKLPSNWTSPFHLRHLGARSCNINDSFPQWLQTQKNLSFLDLSGAGIYGVIPKWFTSLQNLDYVDLSHNQIKGTIPISLCLLIDLEILDLQSNLLTGTIPDCWVTSTSLSLINLSNNRLVGNIPCFYAVSFMHLDNNNLYGQIPSCLSNLTSLIVLDLGGNQLSGKIPSWIERLYDLKILRLRGNNLDNAIPSELCSLSRLQLLDLGHNQLNGTIPHCLSNLTAMNFPIVDTYGENDGISEVLNGIERTYTTTLGYLMSIDLSRNKLVGGIPNGITNLSWLLSLNLSHNHLTEHIPNNLGVLTSLVSLDLSYNNLNGTIPQSFSALTSLSSLNVSYNNLQGLIPTCTALQTQDQYAYIGNPRLWGCPSLKKCSWYPPPKPPTLTGSQKDDEKEDKHEQRWFHVVIMLGVATGFWGVIGTLMLKKRWRHAYFRATEEAADWVHVRVIVIIKRLWGSKES